MEILFERFNKFLFGKEVEDKLIYVLKFVLILVPFSLLAQFQIAYFPFVFSKAIVFRLLVEIASFVYLFLLLTDFEKYKPRFNAISFLLFAFVMAMTVSAFLSQAPERAFWSSFERMDGAVSYIHLFVYFFLLQKVFASISDWKKIFLSFHVISFIILFVSILASFGLKEGERLQTIFGNPIYLGGYFSLYLFFVFYSLSDKWGELGALLKDIKRSIKEKKKVLIDKSRFFAIVLLSFVPLSLFVIYKTATRGAMIAVAFAVFINLLYLLPRVSQGAKKMILSILLLAGLFFGSLYIFKDSEFVQNNYTLKRISSLSLSDTTVLSRAILWNMSIEAFKEKPILGWGPEGFFYAYNKYYDNRMDKYETWYDRAHNLFFDVLVWSGALGFLSFVAFFIALFFAVNSLNLALFERSALYYALFAYVVYSATVFDSLASTVPFYTIAAFVSFRLNEENQGNEGRQNKALSFFDLERFFLKGGSFLLLKKSGKYLKLVAILLLVFLFVYIIKVNVIEPYKANKYLTLNVVAPSKRIEKALEGKLVLSPINNETASYFLSAYSKAPKSYIGNEELVAEQLSLAVNLIKFVGADRVLSSNELKKDIENLNSYALRYLDKDKENLKVLLNLMALNIEIKNYKLVKELLDRAYKFAPNKVNSMIKVKVKGDKK